MIIVSLLEIERKRERELLDNDQEILSERAILISKPSTSSSHPKVSSPHKIILTPIIKKGNKKPGILKHKTRFTLSSSDSSDTGKNTDFLMFLIIKLQITYKLYSFFVIYINLQLDVSDSPWSEDSQETKVFNSSVKKSSKLSTIPDAADYLEPDTAGLEL